MIDPAGDAASGSSRRRRAALVPRRRKQGYAAEDVTERRAWAEKVTGADLQHVGSHSIPSEEMRGNIENPIGAAQMPLGLAGPLEIRGEHATGTFYVPLATTEGALVRSYERGMVCLTRAGGAEARVHSDENRVGPIFRFEDLGAAAAFAAGLDGLFDRVKAEAESTTRHGKLLRLVSHPLGRDVIVDFRYSTGDAQGMNMIAKATDKACRWLVQNTPAKEYQIFSGFGSEKRAGGSLLGGGKGKRVTAGACIPRDMARSYLHATPEQFVELWRRTVLGHLEAGVIGYNGHYANGLTALFIATGQDVANVANSAVGITGFEITDQGDLYASVCLHSLSVGTVGGGTGLGTSRECLELLGCTGTGSAKKLAEIAAATVLSGELSMAAALVSGEFVDAHETYGRNRPQ